MRYIDQSCTFPIEIWRPAAKAVLLLKGYIIFHVIHQIKIAHFVLPRGANKRPSLSIAFHCTSRSQSIVFHNGIGIMDWIKHLRRHRIFFSKLYPSVIRLDYITGNYTTKGMRVNSICKGINCFVFLYGASCLHVFYTIWWNVTACSK